METIADDPLVEALADGETAWERDSRAEHWRNASRITRGRKAEIDCKYRVNVNNYDILEAYAFNLSTKDRRQIRRIIFDHFDYVVDQWEEFQRRRAHE
jgi:hypothetical protein